MSAHTGLLVDYTHDDNQIGTRLVDELVAHPGKPMVASTIPSVISSLGSAWRDLADAIAIHLHIRIFKHSACWPRPGMT